MSTPIRTYTTVNGIEILTSERWVKSGIYHPIDGPTNGSLHRTDGPAIRVWHVVGELGREEVILVQELWYLNGVHHRLDGPAWQTWQVVGGHGHEDGHEEAVLTIEGWYLNGKLHRTDGPALRQWEVVAGQDEPVLTAERWFLQGRAIHPRFLRQPVRAIERWWLSQQERRQQGIEDALWDNGMTVFPGFMGLLREY